jgi:energy-coupling factor transport system permease protein
MEPMHKGRLDPRAWAMWAAAASLPALLARNPWPMTAVLVAVIGVRIAWAEEMTSTRSWNVFLRLALIFATVSVVFNVLTVRAGDRVIARLPDGLPIIGGEISLNAAVYGILSGLALVLLVMIGSTVSALLDWSAVVRMLPESMTSIAVAGSIAFAFIPQTAIAYGEIREAQTARGHRVRGARDLLPILVPLIGSGLDRAITLAESLESRGFGAPADAHREPRIWIRYLGACGLAAATIAVYLFVTSHAGAALAAFLFAGAAGFVVARSGERRHIRRTRYRAPVWHVRDTVVAVASAIAIVATILLFQTVPAALRYEPYPHLVLPVVSLPLVAAQLLLLAPVFVAPSPRPTEARQ